jgi:hypothetical protein
VREPPRDKQAGPVRRDVQKCRAGRRSRFRGHDSAAQHPCWIAALHAAPLRPVRRFDGLSQSWHIRSRHKIALSLSVEHAGKPRPSSATLANLVKKDGRGGREGEKGGGRLDLFLF